VAVLNAQGQAEASLPDWFGAINTDFRYQLTCLGNYAPVYIAEEVQDNRFTIAGGSPGMKVCWQLTSIRRDAWAAAHGMLVEEDKQMRELGYKFQHTLHRQSE
jgi:hypothetical protein